MSCRTIFRPQTAPPQRRPKVRLAPPSSAFTDPKTAHGVATIRITPEIQRLQAGLSQEREAAARVSALDEDVGRAEARIQIVDDQIATLAKDASVLSQALVTLTPHIHGDDCPVCGRNFTEVSAEPLIGHVQQKIAGLTEQATRLSALALEKSDATGRLSALQRERETERSKRLGPGDLVAL
jgi:exonuclease SbcC